MLSAKFQTKTFDVRQNTVRDWKAALGVFVDGQRHVYLGVRGMSGNFQQIYEDTLCFVNGMGLKPRRDFPTNSLRRE